MDSGEDIPVDDMPSLVPIDPEERPPNPSLHRPSRPPHIEDLLDMLMDSTFTFPPPQAHLDLGDSGVESPIDSLLASVGPDAPSIPPQPHRGLGTTGESITNPYGNTSSFSTYRDLITSSSDSEEADEVMSSDNESLPPLLPIGTIPSSAGSRPPVSDTPSMGDAVAQMAPDAANDEDDFIPALFTPSGSEGEEGDNEDDSDFDLELFGTGPPTGSGLPPLVTPLDPLTELGGFTEFLANSIGAPPTRNRPSTQQAQPRGEMDNVFNLIRLLTNAVNPISSAVSSDNPNPDRARILLRSATVINGDALKRYQRLHSNGEDANCPICTESFSEGEGIAHAEWSEASTGQDSSAINSDSSEEPKPFVAALPCNHVFHSGCLFPWLCRNSTCPLCRFKLDPNYQAIVEAQRTRDRIRTAQRHQTESSDVPPPATTTVSPPLTSLSPPRGIPAPSATRPRANSLTSLFRNLRPVTGLPLGGLDPMPLRPRASEVPTPNQLAAATNPPAPPRQIPGVMTSLTTAIGGLAALQEDLRVLRDEQELLMQAQIRRGMPVDPSLQSGPFFGNYVPPKGPKTFEEMLIAKETEDGLRCQGCKRWLSDDVKEILGSDYKLSEKEICNGCMSFDSLD